MILGHGEKEIRIPGMELELGNGVTVPDKMPRDQRGLKGDIARRWYWFARLPSL